MNIRIEHIAHLKRTNISDRQNLSYLSIPFEHAVLYSIRIKQNFSTYKPKGKTRVSIITQTLCNLYYNIRENYFKVDAIKIKSQ
jgi:hypothetical protein